MRAVALAPAIWGAAPEGARVVRLVYVDEAGISNAAQEPFLVVSGVVLHADDQLIATENALDELVAEWIPVEQQRGFVFHAKELFNGGGKVFRRNDPSWPLERRLELADRLAALPAQLGLKLSLGVLWKPQMTKPANATDAEWAAFNHAVSFLSCAVVVESWMRAECPKEVCLIIAEDNDQARSVIRDLVRMNQRPDGLGSFTEKYAHLFPFRHIKEDPLFQPKRSSSVLQLADFWAYVAKKHYMKDPRYSRFTGPMWPCALPHVWPNRPIPG